MDRFLPASPASIVDHPRTAMRARNVTTAPNAGPSRGDAALIRLERARLLVVPASRRCVARPRSRLCQSLS
jgi:hypothetical protein